MTLNNNLLKNSEAMEIVLYFKEKSNNDKDDVIVTLNFINENLSEKEANKLIHDIYVLVHYMTPDINDVILYTFYARITNNSLSKWSFIDMFENSRGKTYYNDINTFSIPAHDQLPAVPVDDDGSPKYDKTECELFHIMQRICDKEFQDINKEMNKKGFPNSYLVHQAYQMSRIAHYWTKRGSGEPYINHPIQVAKILVDFGVESSVIAAAILHDVAEDTDIDIEEIAKKISLQVSLYVDAVTSLHREYEKLKIPKYTDKDKLKIDKDSVEKLAVMVESDPNMIFALYIKAADRIHNLSTMETMSDEKIQKKIAETRNLYLPLFVRYKLNFFVNIIEDLLWKLGNKEIYNRIQNLYSELQERNMPQVKLTISLIKSCFDDKFDEECQFCANIPGYEFTFENHTYSPLEIKTFLRAKFGKDTNILRYLKKDYLPILDLNVIMDPLDNRCDMGSFATVFIKQRTNVLAQNGCAIIDFETDDYKRFIVTIEDKYYNIIRCCFCMREDYIKYLNGGNNGFLKTNQQQENIDTSDTICVKLRNGKPIFIERGSTAIDVAFVIHREVGLSIVGARVNSHPIDIFTPLADEVTVVIEADTNRKDGYTEKFTPHAKLEWLNHVKTNKAREYLIEYFQQKYE